MPALRMGAVSLQHGPARTAVSPSVGSGRGATPRLGADWPTKTKTKAYLKTYIKIKPSHEIYDRNILYGAMKFNLIKI